MGTVRAIDLFCGLGGFSEGAEMADVQVVWAANHWPEAVQVHANNHADTVHSCQDLKQADWTLVPPHDLLLASPACQGHSRARGKERAYHDAQRSTDWAVVDAVECHRPPAFIVENVTEFLKWTIYPVWRDAMERLGYALSINIIDAADHDVPQNRLRVFIVGTRSAAPIDLQLDAQPYVGADSFIDFNGGRWSAINKPGRSPATLSRIAAGRARFGSRFLTAYYGNEKGGRCISRPVGTITTRDRWAIIDGDRMRMFSVEESRVAMGFRKSYQLPTRAKDAQHMLGNAVCPPVAAKVIRAVKARA